MSCLRLENSSQIGKTWISQVVIMQILVHGPVIINSNALFMGEARRDVCPDETDQDLTLLYVCVIFSSYSPEIEAKCGPG